MHPFMKYCSENVFLALMLSSCYKTSDLMDESVCFSVAGPEG
jgi:hypothetical protein